MPFVGVVPCTEVEKKVPLIHRLIICSLPTCW